MLAGLINAIGNSTNLHGRIAEHLGVGILSGKIRPGEVSVVRFEQYPNTL
jgi:hypothetical protein